MTVKQLMDYLIVMSEAVKALGADPADANIEIDHNRIIADFETNTGTVSLVVDVKEEET